MSTLIRPKGPLVLLAMLAFSISANVASADETTAAKTADKTAAKTAKGNAQKTADAGDPTKEGAAGPVEPVEVTAKFMINNLWIMIAGMLVFIMHLGFATLESGLTRSKNTVNILFKNTMIICIGFLSYGVIGFNLMYPNFDTDKDKHSKTKAATTEFEDDGIFKFAGFGFTAQGPEIAAPPGKNVKGKERDDAMTAYNKLGTPQYNAGYTVYTDFFFQAMFAATCCTIVSGAVAGRIKLSTFLVFAALFVTISYPITGSWQWGKGWLDRAGFYDFAGSTLVHSVGGWGALVMAILLGPRSGKYIDGRVHPMPASNLPLAAVGVFLLWFGWFGFNGGSVLSADPGRVSLVLVTTSMAAAAGGLSAALVSWAMTKKPDLSMALNGILAGLVGITAGADQMSSLQAIVIGAIAGVIVYFAVVFIDTKLKIDDPVGAISVHLVCGVWGTLAVGLFGASAGWTQLMAQVQGIVAIGAFTLIFAGVVGIVLKATMGLRVSPEEELEGLDMGEHGMKAYQLQS